jgi:predicted phage terminase large subunit-like protein
MEYPELKRAVREQCQAFDASVVLIEDKASGTQLIQELTAEGLHAVTRYRPQSDKIMRMHAQTAMIENGFVHLPKEAPWLAEYLHELTVFPKGKHDDQVPRALRPGGDGADARLIQAGEQRPHLECGNLAFCTNSDTRPSRRACIPRGPNRYR